MCDFDYNQYILDRQYLKIIIKNNLQTAAITRPSDDQL